MIFIVAICGAVCFGLSAICTGVAVSYYAAVVVQDFYMAGGMSGQGLGNSGGMAANAGSRYIYGTALFIGWFALVMGLIGMVLQILGTTGNSDEDEDWNPNQQYPPNQTYNNPTFIPKQTRPGTEFI